MRIHHLVILDKLGDGTLYPGDGYSGGQITFAGQAKERQQSIALGYQYVSGPIFCLSSKLGYHQIAVMQSSRSWVLSLRRYQDKTLSSAFAESHLRGRP
jgi:hypothetical protein